ncbi:EamA family transporter [Sagittula sp. NFXS13]|uniref:EamA family transporter n=1 Tax=Sagittula sp. NFXS13 TaxID=2819095 RepID=UPI0032DEFBE1
MSIAAFLLIFVSVSLSALGQTFFKRGVSVVRFAEDSGALAKVVSMLMSPWVLAGLAVYGLGTVLWLFALKKIDLSLAYPFVAMSFVMVAGAGVLVLGETLTLAKALGLTLIVSGLVVMAFGN